MVYNRPIWSTVLSKWICPHFTMPPRPILFNTIQRHLELVKNLQTLVLLTVTPRCKEYPGPCNRLFQNNWIFLISTSVPKPLSILFRFYLSKESKTYCIFDCLRQSCNSRKSDSLVLTKTWRFPETGKKLSRVPTKKGEKVRAKWTLIQQ